MPPPILELRRISKSFKTGGFFNRQAVLAVDQISLAVPTGGTVGLVGESGSGKSTLARIALGLTRPTAGEILFDGRSFGSLSRTEWHNLRQQMQPVFQDPASSLNPRKQVREIVRVPLDVHSIGNRSDRPGKVVEVLERVGLGSQYLPRYPHQLSGGERQRVSIARAIVMEPRLLIADEPTSALDVSVQAQLLRLFADIQRDMGIAYLFISHNLAVVKHVADWVAVMYLGRIVEYGTREQVFGSPQHPYTQALLSAVPVPDPLRRRDLQALAGELPSPSEIPSGCRFRDRCPKEFGICAVEDPPDYEPVPGKRVACHLMAAEQSSESTANRGG